MMAKEETPFFYTWSYIYNMKILNKQVMVQESNTRITRLEIEAPLIASKVRPGQFIVIMVKEVGERIPLTVVDKNETTGSIVLIVQELGFTTKLLGSMEVGDSIYAIAGPMGHATELKDYGDVILIGGGVGIAELYPLAKGMKEAGNNVTTILGARTKELLILEDELKAVSDKLYLTTDDGTYGKKGYVTDILKELLMPNAENQKPNLIYAVGPIPMMKLVSDITKEYKLKTIVSLNALMVDATGMCGGCRVKIGDEVKFSCVDGPEFDAHLVDWEELVKRTKAYVEKENHICRLNRL
ncbi:MAG: sulfide/dihydroorotate dehydrogenase-like FAD/NAD-binding protein [Candidatus Orphnella occulta]|nr:sulfide/dihydroorotate dehydrogenase-like FAD/NAD-binding protein [Candidatus Orphnella occulta]